jgi:hypothetical protein
MISELALLTLVALQQFDILHLLLRSIDDRGRGRGREEKSEYELGEVHDDVRLRRRTDGEDSNIMISLKEAQQVDCEGTGMQNLGWT